MLGCITPMQRARMSLIELHTQRLQLRNWQASDLPRFAALNNDAQVMQHFPERFNREQSDALAARIQRHIEQYGFGVWVLESHKQPGMIGILGMQHVLFDSAFTPAVEIAWRLLPAYWQQGLATEAAQAALRFAFERLELSQLLAFTVPANQPSQALMLRLGMLRDPADDFLHPLLPKNHPLRPHVLYRLERDRWLQREAFARN
jgi:RimJ/RimL family protein N-acetyltransferase